jgi:hypothetical protein
MKTITITISRHTIIVGAAFVVTFLIGMCLGVSIGMNDGYRAHKAGVMMIRSNEMSGKMMGDTQNIMWHRSVPATFDVNQ